MIRQFAIKVPDAQFWPLLERSADYSCFFTPQWAAYLERMGKRLFVVEVCQDKRVVGFFVGSRRWLGVRIVSSPSMGTGTYAQGLCMLQPVSQEERVDIYVELTDWLLRNHEADYIQVCDWQLHTDSNDWIDNWRNPLLENAKIKYNPRHTFHLDLRPSEEELWANLQYKSCKYSINKARKEGLAVRVVTEYDEIEPFVRQHHEHINDVLRRHGNRGLPCQREQNMLALCQSLSPNNVLMIQVVGPDENGQEVSMASGIFAFDQNVCTYFTGGSYQRYMKYCPNELMVWEAIQQLHRRGVKDLIFGGIGHYKKKFNPVYAFVPVMVFSRYKLLLNARKVLKEKYVKLIHLFKKS